MSSILEALRKSEQNRQQQIPNNGDQLRFSNQQQPKSRKGFYLLCMLLLLIVVALWLYQQGIFSPQLAHQNATATSPQKPLEQPQPQVAQGIVPPDTDLVKKQAQQLNKPQALPKVEAAAAEPVASQSPATNAEPQTPKPIEPIKTAPKNQPSNQVNTASSPPNNSQNPPANKPLQQQPEPKQQHLRIYQLPYAVRKDLPPIKLNIHVYDPNVENRMVILNGERYAVGDQIEEAGSVKEITQEGVVLEFNGVTFMIPKL